MFADGTKVNSYKKTSFKLFSHCLSMADALYGSLSSLSSLHGGFTSKADSLWRLYFKDGVSFPQKRINLQHRFIFNAAFLQSSFTRQNSLSDWEPPSKAPPLSGSLPYKAASLFRSLQLRRLYPMTDPWEGSRSFCQPHLPKQLCLPRQSFSKRASWNSTSSQWHSMLNGTLTQDRSPNLLDNHPRRVSQKAVFR